MTGLNMKVKIKYGNFASTITGLPKGVLLNLREELKYENDFKQRIITKNQSKGRYFPPKYSYLMTKEGEFYTGLLQRVELWLHLNNFDYEIEYKNELRPLEVKEIKKVVDRMSNLEYPIKLRPYQKQAIFQATKTNRGIFYLATGLGKSVILAVIAEALNRNVLILCQSTDLAKQLIEEIEFYTGNADVGFIGNSIFKPKRVTVGILQSFNMNRKKGKTKQKFQEYLDSVEGLIVDECHNAQANSYDQLLSNLKNCDYRIGMSATPFTSSVNLEGGGKGDFNILLHAQFGEYLYKMNTRDGINKGYLANPRIELIDFPIEMTSDIVDYSYEYEKYIVYNDDRNDYIARRTAEAWRENKRVVIFVNRIDHGNKIIEKILNNYSIPEDEIAYVNGQLPKDERKALLLGFKSFNKNIIIGTVLKEGLNFACDVGINAAAGESRRNAIQSIGRLLRKTRNPETNDIDLDIEENVVYIDFYDRGHPFFTTHSKSRHNIYKDENHIIDIVKLNEE